MHSPRSRCHSHIRARLCVAVLSFLLPIGCLDSSTDDPPPPVQPDGIVHIEVVPWRTLAPRSMGIEPGGRLIVELRDPARRRSWLDSVEWDATRTATLSFRGIPQGGNYLLVGRYRDAQGRFTHTDSLAPVSVSVGEATSIQLRLRALIGRLVFTMPSVPANVDSLLAIWKEGSRSRSAVASRGTGGRTVLRLDSLPVGATGKVALRAWNSLGDTLFFLDTTLSVQRDADQSVSLVWRDASASPGVLATAMPGGEVSATLRFPGESVPDGRLWISGLSDSGGADWILLENPGTGTVNGTWKVQHGSESASIEASIEPGGKLILTRAACETAWTPGHVLQGPIPLACGVDLPVSWSTPSTLWELRDATGSLVDQVLVWDGQNGWPDLNASSARTLRRRGGEAGMDAMAGRSWCALATADPAKGCP
ncbi:MAG: lamin tail domain-containing protein [Fibrobacteres bacterium]|nr:lamin tail domain-containing protein [Fibrobacterota bacterium]